jgi:hypothetical protein
VALPWNEVNSAESQTVAEMIGLRRLQRGERRKWGCPFCGSSDSLHAYAGVRAGFGCWGACGADQPKGCRGFSVIDVARAHWDASLPDTCRRLADRLGIVYEDGPQAGSWRQPPTPPRMPRERVSPQERNLAAVQAARGRLPPVIYRDILSRLRLTARGWAYLSQNRKLDAGSAAAYGYRSVDGPREWSHLAVYLSATYREDELRAAGFPLHEDSGTLTLPFAGRFPALVLPYRFAGDIVGLRFRNLLPDRPEYKGSRYRTLTAAKPPWPYNADALSAGGILYVIEGDLNAETVRQYGESAIGTYGAGMWQPHWTPCLARADRIIGWFDSTDRQGAGDRGVLAFHRDLVKEFGAGWVAERWARLMTAADANELHRRGTLAEVLAMASGPVAWLRSVEPATMVRRTAPPFRALLAKVEFAGSA